MSSEKYIGLDVHQATISVAVMVAVEVLIAGAVDFTHPTRADLSDDTVVAQRLANKRILADLLACHGEELLLLPHLTRSF